MQIRMPDSKPDKQNPEPTEHANIGRTPTQNKGLAFDDITTQHLVDHIIEKLVMASKMPSSAYKNALITSLSEDQKIFARRLNMDEAGARKAKQDEEAAVLNAGKKGELANRPIVHHTK
jgi:hypothetical protein